MNTSKTFRRSIRLAALLGATGSLLFLLFCSLIGTAVPAHADGNILRVPDDYATIQAAIDAAQPGDEIRIVSDRFDESLKITKPVTLSGGWNSAFTQITDAPSELHATAGRRAIEINGATPAMVVTISRMFILDGDATGQGGVTFPTVEATEQAVAAVGGAAPTTLTADAAQARLAELAARGLLPGGQTELVATHARIERMIALADFVPSTANAGVLSGTVDCGGGIYVRSAGLHLYTAMIGSDNDPNVASRTGAGAGGGICAIDVPADGLKLDRVTLMHNVAGANGAGLGGGIFVSTTEESAVQLHNLVLYNNVAARGGEGAGGGIYLVDAPGAHIESGIAQSNLASAAGVHGDGGAVAIVTSPGAQIIDFAYYANSANAAWSPIGINPAFGCGGAVYIEDTDNVTISESLFDGNQAALHGEGSGGGICAKYGHGLTIDRTEFAHNWSVVYPWEHEGGQSLGGGVALLSTTGVVITDTTFHNNQTAALNLFCETVYGGALAGVGVTDFLLAGSLVQSNYGGACENGAEPVASGAVSLIAPSQALTIAHNTFTGNIAELGDYVGLGGGALYVSEASGLSIYDNNFMTNTSGLGGGVGGALAIVRSQDVSIEGNRMLGNHAAAAENPQFALGGALAINGGTHLRIENNLLAGNTANVGAAMLLSGNPEFKNSTVEVTNNTFYANVGDSGVNLRQWTTPITLTNNIVVSHTLGIEVESGAAALRYTLYNANGANSGGAGAIDEQHAISGAPAFQDVANDDFHLLPGSAAIDTGDPAGIPPAPPVDIENTPRPFGPRVDIGAYEWHGPQLFLPIIIRHTQVRVGWAVGNGADDLPGIIHTTDGGRTWTRQPVPVTTPGLDAGDISAVDEQTAWAAFTAPPGVAFPYVLHTTDGGATWITQTLPASAGQGVKSVKGVSRSEAWASTLDGVILHTTDGGATWTVIPHPGVIMTQVNRMDVILPHIWLADSANDGAIIHSADGGATWRREVMDNEGEAESPLTVHAVSHDVAWASGTKTLSFFRTVDGGDTWEKVITVGGFDHLDDICGSSDADVWGAQNGDGVNGSVHRVSAPVGGELEHIVVTPPGMFGYTPGGLSCVDNRTAWVVAPKGVPPDPSKPTAAIAFTTDGETWTQAVAPADIRYWKISMVGARR